jgi:hypothetical protein
VRPSLDAYGLAEVGADADWLPLTRAQQRNLAAQLWGHIT